MTLYHDLICLWFYNNREEISSLRGCLTFVKEEIEKTGEEFYSSEWREALEEVRYQGIITDRTYHTYEYAPSYGDKYIEKHILPELKKKKIEYIQSKW